MLSGDCIWRGRVMSERGGECTRGAKAYEMPKRVWFSGNASVPVGLGIGVLPLEVLSDGEYTQC